MDKSNAATQPVRVLEIIGNGIVGGMESYVTRLLRNLPPERFRITCLCPFESRFSTELRKLGLAVHIAPIPDEPGWRSILYGSSLIEAEGIEVLHSHLPNAHMLAGMLSKMCNVPALATIHGQDVLIPDVEIHRLAGTHVNVVSQAAYYQALAAGIPRSKLTFIANAVDGDVFKPQKTSRLQTLLGLAEDTPLVGFVGRLSPEKGPEVFVRAAISASRRLPGAHFVLLGDGPMRERLEQMVASSGMESFIHFAGVRTDMHELYGSLSAVVSTSYAEGMPLAIMEAQSCGLPMIATHVGGVPDIVVMDVTGALVQAGKPEDTANAIVALMSNPARREAWGTAARERMQTHFRLQDRIADISQLLTRLARGSLTQNRVSNVATMRTSTKEARTLQRAPTGTR